MRCPKPLTQQLKGSKWRVAPRPYWLDKDRLLADIYDEAYPVEDQDDNLYKYNCIDGLQR